MARYTDVMQELYKENNLEVELLSKNWISKMKKDGKIKYYIRTKSSLNNYASAVICNDKYATYCVLTSENIPVLEHKILFNPSTRDKELSDFSSLKEIKEYFKQHGKLVIKDNLGTKGLGVYLCKNFFEVKRNIKKLFKRKDAIVILPFYDIETEYRCIYLDGNVELIYAKYKEEGGWKHNLSQGAKAKIVTDEALKQKLEIMAKKVALVLDVRFVSIDISQLATGELYVMEVNSGVIISKAIDQLENGYEKAKRIYQKAMEKVFE
ncbi:MAG: hypothetical protein J6B87_03820 [Clostridia bacterium]|nr:hypothetical protein [Clostridia bacterium]